MEKIENVSKEELVVYLKQKSQENGKLSKKIKKLENRYLQVFKENKEFVEIIKKLV